MKESDFTSTTKELLQYHENMGHLLFTRNNSGTMYSRYTSKKTGKTKSYAIPFGKLGSPDFFVFVPNGCTIHLELKTDSVQSEEQVKWQVSAKKLNHNYHIAHCMEDVERILETYGVRRF